MLMVSLVDHSGLKRCLTNVISHGFNGKAHIRAGIFNVFQAKDPQTDGEMERGPPTYIY